MVDVARFKKIIASMERAGLQSSFQEFVVDYIHDYPEDRKALVRILEECQIVFNDKELGEFLSAPNYVERSLKKFVDELDAFPLRLSYDRFIEKRLKIKKWKELSDKGARDILLSREVPLAQRVQFKEFVVEELRKVDPNTRPKKILPFLPW